MEESREMQVGKVTHYFAKAHVAVIEIKGAGIKVGNNIHIKGHTTDFIQNVESMQIEHEKIEMGEPGQSIGLKVDEPVRANDIVYKAI